MRREPREPLVCPEDGYDVELVSYENTRNRYNPRVFRFKASRQCGHWPDRGKGGGPESPQHDWVKYRVAHIARLLGHDATVEDEPTDADVFIHDTRMCFEVQLKPTAFNDRTKARQRKDAHVCWLIRFGLDTPKATKALFELPAGGTTPRPAPRLGQPTQS